MLIHIFEDTPHHYIPMRTFFTEKCCVAQPQEFWVRASKNALGGSSSQTNDSTLNENNFITYDNAADLIKKMSQKGADSKFFFHGLLDVNLYWRLLLSPIITRSSCIFWGYELYRYKKKHRPIKLMITQWLHRLMLQKFSEVLALTPGDAQLVTRKLKREKISVLPYPGIGLTDIVLSSSESNNNKITIMVGNSAAETNEHLDAFEGLKHLRNEDVEIIVPLNYAGESAYIDKVIREGKKCFGEKFTPITQMLTKVEYDALLNQVDCTVFAHHRQQGLYVAYAMLLMGKPVYLRENTTSYQNFILLGFSVNTFETLAETSINEISRQTKTINTSNQTLMHNHYTEQALAPKWSAMLNNMSSVVL